ncbi:hypothetical protein ANCDUO_01832 [Ancylostoma duodenale]|uniref:Uncharacterized protein n=1 Tax=Ancylostoma duodenale TaxID=51022 RepID=A0A0C2HE67_9BILA|nr:hypothetical protein ANCDUO_01832 [Ancylostoma duodenale]
MPASEDEISSADVFDAIVNRAPGPLDIPVMRGISLPHTTNSHNMLPSTSTTHRPIIIDVTLPFSSTAWFLSKISTLVGPPTNIRVEATSNSSAVVQWDFENGQVAWCSNLLRLIRFTCLGCLVPQELFADVF